VAPINLLVLDRTIRPIVRSSTSRFYVQTEIRYKKLCIFLTGGAYALYAPCMSTPLVMGLVSKNLKVIHVQIGVKEQSCSTRSLRK